MILSVVLYVVLMLTVVLDVALMLTVVLDVVLMLTVVFDIAAVLLRSESRGEGFVPKVRQRLDHRLSLLTQSNLLFFLRDGKKRSLAISSVRL